jgi:predicted branched-subunit amino acid permease
VPPDRSRDLRAGAASVAPMLVGVVPFALVAGATPVEGDLGGGIAIGLSTIVFAGASQLAAADVLIDGGSAIVAVLAACTINLRMTLYSASLSPHLGHVPLRTRMFMAYLLTDQAYAVSIQQMTSPGGQAPERRVPYYLGAALLLWGSWQLGTIAGVLIGPVVPEDVPLEFAVPLVFLVLLIPALTTRPAVVAAAVGGLAAVAAAELGAGPSSIMAGAVCGIVAGTLADLVVERRRGSAPPTTGLDVGTGHP